MKQSEIRKPLILQLVVGLMLTIGQIPYTFIRISNSIQNGSLDPMLFISIFCIGAGILNIVVYFRNKKRYEEYTSTVANHQ